MPMAGNIVKVTGLVIVECPGQAILGRGVCMVIKRCVLGMQEREQKQWKLDTTTAALTETSDKDKSKE